MITLSIPEDDTEKEAGHDMEQDKKVPLGSQEARQVQGKERVLRLVSFDPLTHATHSHAHSLSSSPSPTCSSSPW